MLKHSPDAPADPLPSLGDLDYRVQGLLSTDSKMSEILLATDRKAQTVIFKIACVQQRARAETNRRAIHNSVLWLQQLRDHTGIAQLQPIQRKGPWGPRTWFAPPTFVATLSDWPDNPDFLITEYLAGGTLNSFVGKRPLPVDLALTLTYELAQTLAYLHAHGCVHRDLKPENVLFRVPPAQTANPGTMQPVLIDFGIAARIGEPKLISGSRLWMAPELQVAYEKSLLPVDPTWDVYGLGLICCYMLSGIRPRRRQHDYQDYIDYRDRVFALLQQEAAGADAAWQQVVAALQKLLTHTLALDPSQRPTAAEFAAALATILDRMGIAPAQRTARSPQWYASMLARWHALPMRWRVLGLALLLLLGLLFLMSLLDDQAGSSPTATPPGAPTALATAAMLSTAAPSQTPSKVATAQNTHQIMHTNVVALSTPSLPTEGALQKLAQTTATRPVTLSPPTLAPLRIEATPIIPTLAAINLTQIAPPPTLLQFTPTTPPTPTAGAIVAPTRPLPTATATPSPSPTRPLPTATRQPQPTAITFATIRLQKPPQDVVAAQERVEFAWEASGAALAPDHCYELVFWDAAKAQDKRSPIGAGRTNHGNVTFSKLRESPDPLLRTLARRPQGFDWGVRFVSCASPKTILQDVREVRHYTYQP